MNVRIAGPADAERVLDMMVEFNRDEAIPFSRERQGGGLLPLLDGAAAVGRVLIADEDGVAAGYALVTWSYDIEYGGRDAWLTELYVVPSLRGGGRGRRLLDEAVAVARQHGAGALHLQVRRENAAARALYERHGFEVWTRLGYTRRPL